MSGGRAAAAAVRGEERGVEKQQAAMIERNNPAAGSAEHETASLESRQLEFRQSGSRSVGRRFVRRPLPPLRPSFMSSLSPPATAPLSAPIGRLMAASGDGQRPVAARTPGHRPRSGKCGRRRCHCGGN